MLIGVTGGMGSGKSESINFFTKYGAQIIDCDKISKDCSNSKDILEKLKNSFGEEILKSGEINRKKLREIVFDNKEKLEILNKIMHPEILKRVREEIKGKDSKKLIIVDMPLLYEVGFEKEVEKVVVISAPFEIQLQRVMKRDEVNYEEAVKALRAQMSLVEKVKRADYIIDNGGSKKELGDKIYELILKLKEEA